MQRGQIQKGYTFGKNGVNEKINPKKYDNLYNNSQPNYNNIDKITGKQKNFADMHKTQSGNMFGKPPQDKRKHVYGYKKQYDPGNYTYQYSKNRDDTYKIQYLHQSENFMENQFKIQKYPKNNDQFRDYGKGEREFKKNLRGYDKNFQQLNGKNQQNGINNIQFYREQEQKFDPDFQVQQYHKNTNLKQREYNIITNEEKEKQEQD
ncbi:hypothetical protein PPERSA_07201 [Pseudocohnilembus persalinus]|uniref:Uncharacterized protein n=1 Tax=Pseudocohnilembus persalinus TaxID=266149 RepID=A0A0V0QCZ6_PSEPJ|nr:hypothetical protein PPERSA_07201 [Pseudocohnilembus persalinus]|eukprot:KRX00094.1 hypothetical protein PPERSA_07201 [Pseudocohnilembus persalinus]